MFESFARIRSGRGSVPVISIRKQTRVRTPATPIVFPVRIVIIRRQILISEVYSLASDRFHGSWPAQVTAKRRALLTTFKTRNHHEDISEVRNEASFFCEGPLFLKQHLSLDITESSC